MVTDRQKTESAVSVSIVGVVIAASVLAVSWNGLSHPELEGLDGAHHVMDGVFFHDLLTDLPLTRITSYPFDYYKQYPALGFMFWPLLFPLVEGLIFKVGGISLFTAQLSVLLFSGLLAFCVYRIGRHFLPPLAALTVTLSLLSVPGLYPYFNVVMLEIPVLATMALTTQLYLGIVNPDTRTVGTMRWQSLALAAALALYTKQTAFILFPAIAADLVVNQRHLLRSSRPWLAMLTLCVLAVPLVWLTFTFGGANIEQSVGQDTDLVMTGYQGPARWSLNSWTYYARMLPRMLHWSLLLLALAETVCSLANVERLKRNCLWFGWLLTFYVAFSYFDNKSERFAVLALIPVCMLALLFAWNTLAIAPAMPRGVRAGVLLTIPALQAWMLPLPLTTLTGTHAIMDQFDVSGMDGNIAYLGKFRQPFVYEVRVRDRERSHFVLRGGDLLANAAPLYDQLRDYRILYVFVEPQSIGPGEQKAVSELLEHAGITQVLSTEFRRGSHVHQLQVWRNDNPLASTMKPILLSGRHFAERSR